MNGEGRSTRSQHETLPIITGGLLAAYNGLRVTVTAGPGAGTSAVLSQRSAIVGRSSAADVTIEDPTVSAFHAEITAQEHGVAVRDLQSVNGVIKDGVRIERGVVAPGAVLQMGNSFVQVDLDAPFEAVAQAVEMTFGELHGKNPKMVELFGLLSHLAPSDLSVLVEGPTGCGKELVARAIHGASGRASGPFVVVDCTAIPAALAEAMLFGHERGAFTGATDRRIGLVEAAHGGTLFLDEIGELSADLQPKLLRVLERREIVRVGDTRPRPMDVRVVCATWRDLRAMINQGQFREDLYYRIAQARVAIPPLADRPEDIAVLVRHFLRQRPPEAQGARTILPEALEELERRQYRGNVRELKNTVERAALLARGEVITPADLAFERMLVGEHDRTTVTAPAAAPGTLPDEPLVPFKEAKRTLIDDFERDYLVRLLSLTGGNLSRAASLAGIDRNYLRDLFRRHNLRNLDG